MSVRPAKAEDIPAMLAIYAPFVLETAYSFEYTVPTEEEFLGRFEAHTALYPWLVWEEDGLVGGYAYAGRAFERAAYAWNAEVSCYLAPWCRGRGVGRQLYTALEALLRQQGVRKLYAIITGANTPSLGFHAALGYRRAARFRDAGYKLGAWYDVLWMEKRLLPNGAPTHPPQPWR